MTVIVYNMKGITLVAVGHPCYGKWAYNLALSIKSAEDFPIALMYTNRAVSHLSEDHFDVFDKFIPLPNDTPENTSAKLLAGMHSPWNETLLLDVDMVFLPNKKPSQLFEQLKGINFTAITEGKESEPSKNYFFWADVAEIKSVYEVKEEIYQWRTEVVLFNDEGRKVLNRALEIVKNPRLNTIIQHGSTTPDELGVNIAAAEMGIKPHVYKWQPSYWHLLNGNRILPANELYSDYYLLSMGSNFVGDGIKKVYNSLMSSYCNKAGVQHLFDMESKRKLMPQRAKN